MRLDNAAMHFLPRAIGLLVLTTVLGAQAQSPSQTPAANLPIEVQAALTRAKVPLDAITVLLMDAQGQSAPRLNHRTSAPMNPASVMKLVTTYAALDLLGPAYSWSTPVYLEGAVRDGTLFGNLYIKGQGDPKLVLERLWLLLRRVQGLGIKTIAGDIANKATVQSIVQGASTVFHFPPVSQFVERFQREARGVYGLSAKGLAALTEFEGALGLL